jgi:hypothetical protein
MTLERHHIQKAQEVADLDRQEVLRLLQLYRIEFSVGWQCDDLVDRYRELRRGLPQVNDALLERYMKSNEGGFIGAIQRLLDTCVTVRETIERGVADKTITQDEAASLYDDLAYVEPGNVLALAQSIMRSRLPAADDDEAGDPDEG